MIRKVKSSEGPGPAFGGNWVPVFGKLKKSASSTSALNCRDAAHIDIWEESEFELALEPNMAPKALPFEHPPTSPRELVTASGGARRCNAVRAVYTPIGAKRASRDRQPPKVAGLAKDLHIAATRSRTPLNSIEESSAWDTARNAPEGAVRQAADISPEDLCKALAQAMPWENGAFSPSDYASPRPDTRGQASEGPPEPPQEPSCEKPAKKGDLDGPVAAKINREMREMPRSVRKALMMSEPVADHSSDATAEDWAISGKADSDWGACDATSIDGTESPIGPPQTVLIHGGANQYWTEVCEDFDSPKRRCDGGRDREDERSSEFAFPQAFAFPQTSSGGYPAKRGVRDRRGVHSAPFSGNEATCWAELSAELSEMSAAECGEVLGAEHGKVATRSGKAESGDVRYVQAGKRRKPMGRKGDDRVNVMDLFLPVGDNAYVQEGEGGQGAPEGPSFAADVSAEPGSYGSDFETCESGECAPRRTGGGDGREQNGHWKLNYLANTMRGSNEVDGCRESFDSDEGPLVDTAFEAPLRAIAAACGDDGASDTWGNKGSGYMCDTARNTAVSSDGGHQRAACVWDVEKSDVVEVLQARSSRTSPMPSGVYTRDLHTSPCVALPYDRDRVSGKVKGRCFEPSTIVATIFRKLAGRSGRRTSRRAAFSLPMDLNVTGCSLGEDDPNKRRMQRYHKRQTSMLKVVEERLQDTTNNRRASHLPRYDVHMQPHVGRSDASRPNRGQCKPVSSVNKDKVGSFEGYADTHAGKSQGHQGRPVHEMGGRGDAHSQSCGLAWCQDSTRA